MPCIGHRGIGCDEPTQPALDLAERPRGLDEPAVVAFEKKRRATAREQSDITLLQRVVERLFHVEDRTLTWTSARFVATVLRYQA